MPEALFIGGELESYPFRLAGIATLVPAGEPDDPAWLAAALEGSHTLLFVSESVLLRGAAAVRELQSRLPAGAALTIVPDPTSSRSDHLRFMRLQTMRALGVDTWTADSDVNAGANP
jgi:hypothetical protein